MDSEKEFLTRLKVTFQAEAGEHLERLTHGLLAWESGLPAGGLLEELFRETHSLKGAARSVDMREVESLCQPLEGVFSAWKKGAVSWSLELGDLLHAVLDALAALVHEEPVPRRHLNELTARLESLSRDGPAEPLVPARESEPVLLPKPSETIRVATAKLDPLLLQAEELIQVKTAAQERLTEWKALLALAGGGGWRDRFARSVEAAEKEFRVLRRLVEEHLESTKELLVQPASMLTEGFPKLVRDLARDQGKEAELVVRGADLQLDKRLLEELKSPLVHLLRNGVDHGIETPGVRESTQKRRKGTISLDFSLKDGRRWEVVVRDDGAGLDREKLVVRAVQGGLLTPAAAEALDPDKRADLVFLSGLSTSDVGEVSGRGVGLAIVREKIQQLGGTVSVESRAGEGTAFRLEVPLALSTLRGVLIGVGNQQFIIPSTDIEAVVRPLGRDILTTDKKTLRHRESYLPLHSLAAVLGLPAGAERFAVILSRSRKCAFLIDEVVEETWILVKTLAPPLTRVRNLAGATVLGSGRVVPVLHTADLLGGPP